ncbi:MAG TPA: hypothetical protein V6D17_03045 [Candidatus Obscuribacterales bacterium]
MAILDSSSSNTPQIGALQYGNAMHLASSLVSIERKANQVEYLSDEQVTRKVIVGATARRCMAIVSQALQCLEFKLTRFGDFQVIAVKKYNRDTMSIRISVTVDPVTNEESLIRITHPSGYRSAVENWIIRCALNTIQQTLLHEAVECTHRICA